MGYFLTIVYVLVVAVFAIALSGDTHFWLFFLTASILTGIKFLVVYGVWCFLRDFFRAIQR